MSQVKNFWVELSSGEKSYFHFWKNDLSKTTAPRGWVWLVHGMSEHLGRYDEFARYLNSWGVDVVGVDLPGHGGRKSQELFEVGFTAIQEKIKTIQDSLFHWLFFGLGKEHGHQAQNFSLMGHSLGALILMKWVQDGIQVPKHLNENMPEIKKLILINPPLRIEKEIPQWKEDLAGVLFKFLPKFGIDSGLKQDELCRDDLIQYMTTQDKQYLSTTNATYYFSLKKTIASLESCQNFELPLHFILGDLDPLASSKHTLDFYRKMNGQKSLYTFKGYRHELLNEINRKEVFDLCLKTIIE